MGTIENLLSERNAHHTMKKDDLLFPVSDEQRDKLQHTLIEMYKDIINFCKDKGLTPFLVGGSALGAIRHHGFIPWDDDLDVGFIRKEYEIFVESYEKAFQGKYVVNSAGHSKNAKTRFTKINKVGTICREIGSPPDESINGIFVDVFPIDNVPDNKCIRKIKGTICNIEEFISTQVYFHDNRDELTEKYLHRMGNLNYYIRKFTGAIFSYRKSSSWFKKIDRDIQHKNDNSRDCTIAVGRKHYFGEILNRDVIFPARYVSFETIEAPVFHDVEAYLSNMYGEYMKIPPEEKREKHMVMELKFGDE